MIHILSHEYSPSKGGAGVYCRELALALSKNSKKVTLWVPKNSTQDKGLEFILLSENCSQSFLSSWRLISKTKQIFNLTYPKGTILHLAEPAATRAFIRFYWHIPKNAKIILTIHGSELQRFTRNPIEKLFFRKLILRSSKIHVLSKFNQEKLIGQFPFSKSLIKRIPGAASSRVMPDANELVYNKEKSTIEILCVARIHPRKGQDQILLSLQKLPQDIQENLIVRFLGPKIRPNFLRRIKKIQNQFLGKVLFMGDCSEDELKEAYTNADIFALTSMPKKMSVEGFGFVYLEASSHGLPIVANRIGGVEDAVIHEETGLLSHPHDLHTLSENFKRLISDQSLREKLGKNGVSWANSHSWDKIARDLYSDL